MEAPAINVMIVASGLGIGGAEIVMRDLALTLDRARFNVSVCCLKELGSVGQELANAGVDIFTLAAPGARRVNYFSFVGLLKQIRARGIDVVHTHTTDGLADAAVCRLLVPRLRLIHTFHFGNYPHIAPRIRWIERLFSRAASRVVAVGEAQRAQLRRVYGFSDRRISTVRNGVGSPGPQSAADFRRAVGAGDRLLIGTIATLIDQKGLPDLLQVAEQLRDLVGDVKFVVVGEGHRRQQLEALRREKGLEDLVEFTGWVRNAAARALPAFDIFFQPSHWEAMSIAVLEAMAAGKAIVATKVGENPYLIEHARDGLLLEVRDVVGMAASLRQLVGDPELRTRLGEAAGRKVRQGFTVADMTRAYEAIYAESVATRRRVRLNAAAAGKPSTSDRAAARPEIPAERRTS